MKKKGEEIQDVPISGEPQRIEERWRMERMRIKGRKRWYLSLSLGISLSLLSSFLAFGGWVSQEDGFYYYYEDGSPANGWIEEEGKAYYLQDGKAMADTITPDGYYVDYSGAWYRRYDTILGVAFAAPSQAVCPTSDWVGKDCLRDIKTVVNQVFSDNRNLKISESAVEYVQLEYVEENKKETTSQNNSTGSSITGIGDIIIRTTGSTSANSSVTGSNSSSQTSAQKDSSQKTTKETLLLGLYREPTQRRYRLDVKVALDGDRSDSSQSSYYDYGVFLAMAYQISSAPEILADALYSAWEEDNRWGISRQSWVRIGDCMVLYTSGDGFGRFYISRAQGRI